MSGFVYAIGDNEGRVKIGWSADPCQRLTKLQSDCPSSVNLLGLVAATKKQEKECHRLLWRWRLHGDWFRHEGPVAVMVAMLPRPRPRPVPPGMKAPKHNNALTRFRVARGMSQQALAEAVGVSTGSINKFEAGLRRLGPPVIARISKLTGIPTSELRPDWASVFQSEPVQ